MIVRQGKFGVEIAVYLGSHKYTTHDINIVKYCWSESLGREVSLVIADFNEKGDLVSIGTRLLEEIECMEDFEDFKAVARVAEAIINTDPYPTNKEG